MCRPSKAQRVEAADAGRGFRVQIECGLHTLPGYRKIAHAGGSKAHLSSTKGAA
jgi:hypothetical protein